MLHCIDSLNFVWLVDESTLIETLVTLVASEGVWSIGSSRYQDMCTVETSTISSVIRYSKLWILVLSKYSSKEATDSQWEGTSSCNPPLWSISYRLNTLYYLYICMITLVERRLLQKLVVRTKFDNYVFIIKCKLQSRLVSKFAEKMFLQNSCAVPCIGTEKGRTPVKLW